MMSLQRRRERYLLIHMWKICYSIVPNLCSIGKIFFNFNDRSGIKATVPTLRYDVPTYAKQRFYNSFFFIGPSLWNRIPNNVREKSTLESYKTALDKFLLTIPDEPPTPGYTSQNNNSILQWNISNVLQKQNFRSGQSTGPMTW